ncbi:MAG TPA: hypothetical protein VHY22_10250 [Chthoniobacteraceae bacterium]|nr:hypothetical protein [Chthoniobacteraceae bacterium]
MEEIKTVLRNHDIAAIVVLGSPTHNEYLYELAPTWSCAFVENGVLRIRSARADYPSAAAQRQHVTDTVGLIAGFRDLAEQALDNMSRLLRVLGDHFDITHRTRHE